ncbi:glutamate receptor 1-like [Tubulanus polymorphus]|uniref:glutamate receptor 1-like n=1 Tax=Tubulanus polymorphus TaxID=672921 RepID=UPI003DA52F15
MGKPHFYRYQKAPTKMDSKERGSVEHWFAYFTSTQINLPYHIKLPGMQTYLYEFGILLHAVLEKLNSSETTAMSIFNTAKWGTWKNIHILQKCQLALDIRFDHFGVRINASLALEWYIDKGAAETRGYWYSSGGFLGRIDGTVYEECKAPIVSYHYNVLAVLDKPYIFLRNDPGKKLEGNNRYRGLNKDIFDMVAARMKAVYKIDFNYKITHIDGISYGRKLENGSWTGAMKLLSNSSRYLMVVGGFFRNVDRLQVIDFSPPVTFDGITYIYKPPIANLDYFDSFLRPFTWDAWVLITVSIIAAASWIRLLYFWNPLEKPKDDERSFTMKECMWYAYGTGLQIGGPYEPASAVVRCFTIFLMFFALIVTGCYTGNMASFLTAYYSHEIKHLREFANQMHFSYGVVSQTHSELFFMNSNDPEYQKMAKFIFNNNLTFQNLSEGIDYMMANDNFALIGPSLGLEWEQARRKLCKYKIGQEIIVHQEQVFGMNRRYSHITKWFTRSMNDLMNMDAFSATLNYWLNAKNTCGIRKPKTPTQITYSHFSGVLMMLACAIPLAFFMTCFKLTFYRVKTKIISSDSSLQPIKPIKLKETSTRF